VFVPINACIFHLLPKAISVGYLCNTKGLWSDDSHKFNVHFMVVDVTRKSLNTLCKRILV